jgi:hypothetical protein
METGHMQPSRAFLTSMASMALAALALVSPRQADARECTRLAFSVNDYGKEGPARDAQAMLDQYAKRWTAERGIKAYTMGKKTVTCELFLDLIVFDEYTCKAEASVCWGGGVTGAASAMVRSAAGERSSNPLKPAPVAVPGAPARAQ